MGEHLILSWLCDVYEVHCGFSSLASQFRLKIGISFQNILLDMEILEQLYGSIPLNIHEVWPRP